MLKPFNIGDTVSLKGSNSVGEIIKLNGDLAEVNFNGIVVKVKTEKLNHALKQALVENNFDSSTNLTEKIDTKEKLMEFNFELDIRGLMKVEALGLISKQIDNAILLGVSSFVILHGRSIMLKNLVKTELKKYKEIKKFTTAPKEKGGENATEVFL
jgi:DNA mismatch repair protein MutS2